MNWLPQSTVSALTATSRATFRATSSAALAVSTIGCTQLEAANDSFGPDAGRALTASPLPRLEGADAGLDRPSPIAGCLPVRDRPTIIVGLLDSVELAADETWSCQSNYVLAVPLFIRGGFSLSIGPDTRILARTGTYLLAQRGARVIAEGTREAPIVFSSAEPAGRRAPGDWKGILLAGSAPSHVANAALPGSVSDERAHFGGGPSGAPADDCGRLRFVRIEFAGGSTDEESTPGAGLTLGGCGTSTHIDYVQIHRATDGIGVLGGTVAIEHAVVSNNGFGNAIEWTGGYTGRMQYIVVQGAGAGAALKGSNSESEPALAPVSHPIIYNATAVGISPLIPSGDHYGLWLGHGSTATLRNSIIAHFDDGAVALESAQTIAAMLPSDVSNSTLFHNGPDGATHLPRAAGALQSDSLRDRDPGLDAAARRERPLFVPTDPGVASDIAVTPPDFDPAATYRGALPFQGDDWTIGWTDYPID